MEVSRPKTEVMTVRPACQLKTQGAAPEDFQDKTMLPFEFECEECGWRSSTKHGLAIHKGRWCSHQGQHFEVQAIKDARGTPACRFYLVSRVGYSSTSDSIVGALEGRARFTGSG